MIRVLSIEIYNCVKETNPDYLNEMFSLSDSHYEFRDQSRLEQPKFNTKTFSYRSFEYLGAKLWNLEIVSWTHASVDFVLIELPRT